MSVGPIFSTNVHVDIVLPGRFTRRGHPAAYSAAEKTPPAQATGGVKHALPTGIPHGTTARAA